MSVIPGSLETTKQPPMTLPLRHFVLGFGFLLLGMIVGIGLAIGSIPDIARLAHVHLLLAGWICLTIMGAMTQFVPVWSGVPLFSRRLATVQLWLVVCGLLGFAGSLLIRYFPFLLLFGTLMVAGFWVFVYNIARTLNRLDSLDVTERHFALALGFFLVLTTLGYVLVLDFFLPILTEPPLLRQHIISAHATIAVFGAILTTVIGALYQLATMFTQTELHGIDHPLSRVEEVAYPIGVVLLAGGRLFDVVILGRIGGFLVACSLLGFSLILGRRLYETHVQWTPMLTRYAVVAPLLAVWSMLALTAWIDKPLAREALFGAPGTTHLLVLGIIGFVVFGTLYHIVPFIIWVHRYSDQLGFADVPMIDDLYNDRLATIDFSLLVGGLSILLSTELLSITPNLVPIAGLLLFLGATMFTINMLVVIREHSPFSLAGLLFSSYRSEQTDSDDRTDSQHLP